MLNVQAALMTNGIFGNALREVYASDKARLQRMAQHQEKNRRDLEWFEGFQSQPVELKEAA